MDKLLTARIEHSQQVERANLDCALYRPGIEFQSAGELAEILNTRTKACFRLGLAIVVRPTYYNWASLYYLRDRIQDIVTIYRQLHLIT